VYHTAAYYVALGQTANTDTPAITDGVLTITNGHFRFVQAMQLLGAYASSATLSRARLDSPTLRIPGDPYIWPINAALLPATITPVMALDRVPWQLPIQEEVALQLTSGLACGTEHAYGVIWVGSGITPVPPGRVQWARLTSTTTSVVQTWTNITLTFESALPTGNWCCVGSIHVSTHAVAHRLIFPGQVWRPGNISQTAVGNQGFRRFNYEWSLGEMGRFTNDNPPQCEVLTDTADSSHSLFLALVPVGSL